MKTLMTILTLASILSLIIPMLAIAEPINDNNVENAVNNKALQNAGVFLLFFDCLIFVGYFLIRFMNGDSKDDKLGVTPKQVFIGFLIVLFIATSMIA